MELEARILKVLNSITKKEVSPGSEDSLFVSGLLDSFALTDFVAGLKMSLASLFPIQICRRASSIPSTRFRPTSRPS